MFLVYYTIKNQGNKCRPVYF